MNLKNLSRPAAFLAVKKIIMNSADATDVKRAEKAIDNYIYSICEKPLREERRLDLLYILNWKVTQLREASIDIHSLPTTGKWECPIETEMHSREMYKP